MDHLKLIEAGIWHFNTCFLFHQHFNQFSYPFYTINKMAFAVMQPAM
jgi:hypothetical protein